MATTPKVTQGKYGTISDFGYGKAFSDPRDNPSYTAPTTPTESNSGVTTTPAATSAPTTTATTGTKSSKSTVPEGGYATFRDDPRVYVGGVRQGVNEDGVRYDSIPKTAEQIQSDMIRSAQGEITALDRYYADRLSEQATINDKNDRTNASISTLTGLGGSSEANVQQQKTTAVGQKANTAILNEKSLAVQQLLTGIRTKAVEEARSQREEARLDETTRIANRAARQKEAADMLGNLAASGVTFEGLKAGDKKSYDYLVSQYGSESALKGAMVLNTPQEQIIDKRLENGKYIIAKQNPLTGKITVETMDTGIPTGYSKTLDAGDRIIAIPDNWDGNTSTLKTISKGLTPDQQQKSGTTGGNQETLADFPPDIQSAAQSILDGKSKLNEYPSAKRLQINNAMTKVYNKEGGNELAQGAYDAAVSLKDHLGFKGAVGTNLLLGYGKEISGTNSAGFIAELDKLKANLKLVNIKYLKGTGALSDAEGKTLEDASTSLDPRLPEESFKTELERVTAALAKTKGVALQNLENGIKVTDPNGVTHSFPDQKSADDFKKAAGI